MLVVTVETVDEEITMRILGNIDLTLITLIRV